MVDGTRRGLSKQMFGSFRSFIIITRQRSYIGVNQVRQKRYFMGEYKTVVSCLHRLKEWQQSYKVRIKDDDVKVEPREIVLV